MPLQFPSRDLTNQFISTSYQDVVQRYSTGTSSYFLDGFGTAIVSVPNSSLGGQVLTADQSASYALHAILADTASQALTSYFSDSASFSIQSLFADTASYVDPTAFNNLTLPFQFSYDNSTVAADPGKGKFRYDSLITSSISNIYLDVFTDGGLDVTKIVSRLQSGSYQIYIQEKTDNTRASIFNVNGTPTDNGGWFTIPVAHVSSADNGLPSNKSLCLFLLIDQTILVQGATYPITSSWAVSSSHANSSLSALSSSYPWHINGFGNVRTDENVLVIGNLDVSPNGGQALVTQLSGSSPIVKLGDIQFGANGTILTVNDNTQTITLSAASVSTSVITASLFNGTASYSQQALSASWAPDNENITASWATSSLSASSVSIVATASNVNYYVPFVQNTGSQQLLIDTSSVLYNPSTDTLSVNNVNGTASLAKTASFLPNGTYKVTASYATFAVSAGSAPNPFNQSLNTSDSPSFTGLNVNGNITTTLLTSSAIMATSIATCHTFGSASTYTLSFSTESFFPDYTTWNGDIVLNYTNSAVAVMEFHPANSFAPAGQVVDFLIRVDARIAGADLPLDFTTYSGYQCFSGTWPTLLPMGKQMLLWLRVDDAGYVIGTYSITT